MPRAFYREAALFAIRLVEFCLRDRFASQFLHLLDVFLAFSFKADMYQFAAFALIGFC
jgi:hypothetical protein